MARSTAPSSTGVEEAAEGRRGLLPGALGDLDWRRYVIYIGFVVTFLLFAVTLGDSGFLSSNNLLNILRQTAIITVIAVGMTYVISCAEIDLSVGSVAGLSSVCTAMAISRYGLPAGIVAGLAVGLVVGSVNGGLVSRLGIPSFLVTLGMLGIAAGVAQWITDSAPQPILDDTYNLIFGTGNFGPIPGLIVWSAIFVAVGAVILAKTRFGRQVLATGGNRTAAEFTRGQHPPDQVLGPAAVLDVRRRRRHAVRRPAAVRAVPVGRRRRAVGHRGRDPRRDQPVRRFRDDRGHPVRRPADRPGQQRPDPRRP